MGLANYSELQTSIAEELDRSDLTAKIPDFIVLAESRINSEVRIREMLTRASFSISSRYTSLPSNFLEMRDFRLLTNPVRPLQYVNSQEMTRYYDTAAKPPTYYTIHEDIELDSPPDTSYSGEIIYYKQVDPLATTSTNAILTRAPSLYLYGALLESAPYLLNDERMQTWNALYTGHLAALHKSDRKSQRGHNPVARVIGSTP